MSTPSFDLAGLVTNRRMRAWVMVCQSLCTAAQLGGNNGFILLMRLGMIDHTFSMILISGLFALKTLSLPYCGTGHVEGNINTNTCSV